MKCWNEFHYAYLMQVINIVGLLWKKLSDKNSAIFAKSLIFFTQWNTFQGGGNQSFWFVANFTVAVF